MSIRNLTYFVEVAKEKNFTRAANNLHLSQPALSKVIKNLENDLKVQLIDRQGKQFKLTDAGEIFYNNCETALETINKELEKLYDSVNFQKGKIIVGIPPVIGTAIFPTLLSNFKKTYPDIEIILIEGGANIIKDMIEEGEVDIGVVMLPFQSEQFHAIPMIYSESKLVVHKSHKFADRETVRLEEIKNENFVILSEEYMLYNQIISACKLKGFEPKIIFKSTQWDFLAEMVSINEGITILPASIIKVFKSNEIRSVSIVDPELPWNIGMIIKKNKYISYAMRTFIDFVKREVK
ncbi:bacterial regulatory helix-turn-helix, lysR family protein [Clostridium argentinense CDC 2741]|uniref:Bacterial regulatory helix-turn-helix, lysR family protein n=1 Tax=Clostridium argentinense CDC 2741 TaxID=1418104 RepID=A0A0C1R7U8_9CLOT|nr:LysR family transcriptional regulator [Clostridium argentinense]ARC86440.1 LysR family transcriptional regulator [Clostridium argentinense]KIE46611.1 bacterial regulatory helix-turn-helix, lysR family protein [Clostridium argentinense CDC 2741]NFF37900.1 LysR family transcriptional regulator [Clostridium argentinense]NFP49868.1 LysR family transcriptional regulator [Clostridium argentinense]NFP71292.1 LysR family transcriptional regulator [Clostridium argentinense]